MKTVNDIVWDAIHTGKNAEPWVVHGVTSPAAGATATNPTPTKVDAIGEITTLPFVVPQNRVLVLQSVHISTDPTCSVQTSVKLRLTRPGVSAVTFYELIKCSEHNEHHWHGGFWIPEGSSLRLDCVNAAAGAIYIRFNLDGILVNISEAFKRRRE